MNIVVNIVGVYFSVRWLYFAVASLGLTQVPPIIAH